MTMACKLVAYYRVSTKAQGASGLGLEGQEQAVQAHSTRTGCVIVASFREIESGKKADRPELLKAIAHAKRIGATLVVAKLDRLARNVAFLSRLMESSVEFVACDNPSANRLTVQILAAVAESEARSISERTKAALQARKARGLKCGAALSGSHLTEADRAKGRAMAKATMIAKAVDAYADLVPEMQRLRKQGESFAKVAAVLNRQGHTTRTGSEWSGMQVKRVLDRVQA
jgi:DNA invertase Pin-like site-specific DNA recombinase